MAGDSAKSCLSGPLAASAAMACRRPRCRGLEISPSYINLIERNQRPVTRSCCCAGGDL